MEEDPIITIADMRRVFCVAGIRRWMEEHGYDFRAFVREGLPASQLREDDGGGLLDRVLEAKAAAEGEQNGR